MFTLTNPYVERLSDSLVIKSVCAEEDIERLAAFNKTIHGEDGIDTMTRHLIGQHPDTRPEHWLFVEDETTGKIVSDLCLIPWTWRYEDVELRAGEMAIVGTLEDYRHRGLCRALVRRHHELLADFDLSHIQGIPYFYRQFGYEYALPLQESWRLDPRIIPDNDDPASDVSLRQATLRDVPVLTQLYDEAARDLDISVKRGADIWRYLLTYSTETGTAAETWLIIAPSGEAVGYWRIERYGFGEGLNINEASRLDHATALAALRAIKAQSIDRSKPYIRLILPQRHILARTARAWGASPYWSYAWQIHIPDVARLLRTLSPVFERRIAASPFAGLTQTICLNLYREAFDIQFEDGRISSIDAVGFCDHTPIRIPPLQFVPLVLGYRSREELQQVYPDFIVSGPSQLLIDTLFPKMEAQLYTVY